MKLTVNGEERELADASTVAGLLESLGLANRRVAVEVNRRIVKRGTYDDVALGEGDVVEIVHFVGGG